MCCLRLPCPVKRSHFNFRRNFAMSWEIFKNIFEPLCSGIISAWYSLLHTHHRCEAVTWRDVAQYVSQVVACSAHWHRISYHLTYNLWTHGYSPDLNPVDYSVWILEYHHHHHHIFCPVSRKKTTTLNRDNRAGQWGNIGVALITARK